MILKIEVEIYPEESGLNEDMIKDDVINFSRDLLINGAEDEEVAMKLIGVSYDA